MEVQEIQTPSSPAGEASLIQRIGAAFIDAIIASVAGIIIAKVSSSLYFPVWAGYMLTRDSLPFLGGQSIGKKALHLQAVAEDGKSLSGNWSAGIIRNISMIIPFGGLVELIVMIINKDKPTGMRRLGDQWGKTKVIKTSAN